MADDKINDNNNIKLIKKNANFFRKPKKEQYTTERNDILIFFNNLLNINDNNNKVNFADIDNDNVKIQIRSKKDLIFKIFKASHWGYFVANKIKITDNELSIIKPLYKEFGFEITTKYLVKTNKDGVKNKSAIWHFNKIIS